MHISIVTLFPDMFTGVFDVSIVGRAQKKNAVTIHCINLRDFSDDAYKSVDDHPYGGGTGMILRVDVMDRALTYAKHSIPDAVPHTVLLDPPGKTYRQHDARRLSAVGHLILVCGHYEGFDERIRSLVDEELSIGDYVLTGGELPAMVVVDSIVRLLPSVLSKEDATTLESFGEGGLEYPQYTRPITYKQQTVPDVLLSGNHANIAAWRKRQRYLRTKSRRPDLLTEQTDLVSSDP